MAVNDDALGEIRRQPMPQVIDPGRVERMGGLEVVQGQHGAVAEQAGEQQEEREPGDINKARAAAPAVAIQKLKIMKVQDIDPVSIFEQPAQFVRIRLIEERYSSLLKP
ncbi:MAG: hypothetical protein BWX68_03041 [Verrucomicrobia bacterium ADurb.Bin063]|nr:MAG: hypothetical protein BWX68_03041 [Verrucomicrobia bacterium ADurb.Bin063]